MTVSPGERRPLRSDFKFTVDTPPGAPPWSAQTNDPASTEAPVEGVRESTTMKLQRAWSTTGQGDGGAILDKALTDLGESYAEGDRVVWLPPADLDTEYADYLTASVGQLNQLITNGVVEIADDGTIRPVVGSSKE